ncbi:hypothetical protein [Actinokineospora xionganensis]|uniref:hypothetical protein n=1 Tax=Actinokineospora xionganensis TaxID=2684470 RepID=UPI001FE823C5|nr:hypothetical protein [Actinokineospora xionganensis]
MSSSPTPTPPGSTAQARLIESIAQADALIGIIDGLRVLQAHQGDQRGMLLLQASLDAMINAMLGARTPIAFVITKWDLLDGLHPDENTRLEMVRELLMGVDGFRDLVTIQSTRRIVRLLPVSAVGHDFAVLQGNEVHKRPQGHYRPDGRRGGLPGGALRPVRPARTSRVARLGAADGAPGGARLRGVPAAAATAVALGNPHADRGGGRRGGGGGDRRGPLGLRLGPAASAASTVSRHHDPVPGSHHFTRTANRAHANPHLRPLTPASPQLPTPSSHFN